MTSGMLSCVVLVIYRPGSSAITATFFSELADVLYRFFVEPLVIAGDVNILLERSADPHAVDTTQHRRSWRSFSLDTFVADLQTSELCDERQYEHLDGDALAKLYDDTITALLDKHSPVRKVTCRRRPSCMWFDDECCRAKRTLRPMEMAACRAVRRQLTGRCGVARRETSVLHAATRHDRGGMLDVVVSRDDLPAPSVDVLDVGLSDHRLLRWSVSMSRPPPVYTTADVWCLLNHDAFRDALATSPLCQPEAWTDISVDHWMTWRSCTTPQ